MCDMPSELHVQTKCIHWKKKNLEKTVFEKWKLQTREKSAASAAYEHIYKQRVQNIIFV